MSFSKIIETVTQALTIIASLIPVAEFLFDGTKQGAEKRVYVIDMASKLLAEHVNPFFATSLGKTLIGAIIDALVSVMNKQGNL